MADEFNGLSELVHRQDASTCIINRIDSLNGLILAGIADSLDRGKVAVEMLLLELAFTHTESVNGPDILNGTRIREVLSVTRQLSVDNPNMFGTVGAKQIDKAVGKYLNPNSSRSIESIRSMESVLTPAVIYTPYGSVVTDTYYVSCEDITYGSDMYTYLLNELNQSYPNVIVLDNPTESYNCHGYAWHVSEGGERVWIGANGDTAEDVYWNDGSYVEVPESLATKVSYSGNHSAVRLNSEWYVSKWGNQFLVRHHPNDVPSIYLPGSTKRYYRSAMSISGSSFVCDSVTYTVNNLHNGMSVQWSVGSNALLNDSTMFRAGYPSSNECTIFAKPNVTYSDTLRAHVYVNGVQTAVYGFPFQTMGQFYCDLTPAPVGGGGIVFPMVGEAYDGDYVKIPINTRIRMESQKIKNMSISYSGFTPSDYYVDHANGYVYFSIPLNKDRQVLSILGQSNNTCESFCINFYTGNLTIIIGPPMLNMSVSILVDGEQDSAQKMTDYLRSDNMNWALEIYSVSTGRQMVSDQVNGNTCTFSTAGWENGLYVARVTINGVSYSKTFRK